MTRHKVFISYHHKNDEWYKEQFETVFDDLFINKSVKDGEYDEDLSDKYVKRLIQEDKITNSSVIVVLIGSETYKRKHVDWEISAGLSAKAGGYSGLVGIILPTYYNNISNISFEYLNNYNSDTIPPRLLDNVKSGFAELYHWNDVFEKNNYGRFNIENIIDDAFRRKNTISFKIDNSLEQFKDNK